MRSEIPFRLIGGDQPLIVVSARFNDSQPIDCAIDTGASHAMLLPEVGARLGVQVDETREAMGAGGAVTVRIGKAKTVALGDAVMRDVPILMTDDLRRIGAAIGMALAGNIGHSFLGRFRLTLDYERNALTLATPEEPPEAGAPRAELPFTLAHPAKPLVMIPVEVDGHPFRFAVDTGASTTVISPGVARTCEVAGAGMPSMTGGGGAVAASAAVVSTLAIGPVRISRVRVAVAEFLDGLGQAVGTRIDGIVGTNVLRRFRVTIDYPGKTLRLA
jgi:predicted aspartyl protease